MFLGKRKQTDVLDFNRVVAEKVEKILGQDSFCLTLGGDHSSNNKII